MDDSIKQQLITYIKQQRAKGFEDQPIREALEKVGYPADTLDICFKESHEALEKVVAREQSEQNFPLAKVKHHWVLPAIIFVAVCAVLALLVALDPFGILFTNNNAHSVLDERAPKDSAALTSEQLLAYEAECKNYILESTAFCLASAASSVAQCDTLNKADAGRCTESVLLTRIVLEQQDQSVCSTARTEEQRVKCMRIVREDYSGCKEEQECLILKALAQKNEALCPTNTTIICNEKIRFQNALAAENSEECKSITDPVLKHTCYAAITQNQNACSDIEKVVLDSYDACKHYIANTE